jgi:hypothetical protein
VNFRYKIVSFNVFTYEELEVAAADLYCDALKLAKACEDSEEVDSPLLFKIVEES